MSRQNQWMVTLAVRDTNGGYRQTGVWDKMTGGEMDSEETKYRPGGMGKQISLGGSTSVSNPVLTRLYDLQRDHDLARWLFARCAADADCIVTKQPLDKDGNPYGRPFTYTGVLKRVSNPEHDSDSSDPNTYEVEVSAASSIG